MEETTTTEPLQDGEVAVNAEVGLEEGEICEEGSCQAATRVDVPDQNPEAVQQDHPTSNAIISDEMLSLSSDTAVTVNGAKASSCSPEPKSAANSPQGVWLKTKKLISLAPQVNKRWAVIETPTALLVRPLDFTSVSAVSRDPCHGRATRK
ncbi:hypothetical protein Bca4012_044475 [Brassica carinata]|uniref:(rape) hypothetical protein n=1 Tax=Brassica napus TaxID=3708 RepID=A0A816J3Y2_BRANA|nr:unnamed protein product [Brassica napus]